MYVLVFSENTANGKTCLASVKIASTIPATAVAIPKLVQPFPVKIFQPPREPRLLMRVNQERSLFYNL